MRGEEGLGGGRCGPGRRRVEEGRVWRGRGTDVAASGGSWDEGPAWWWGRAEERGSGGREEADGWERAGSDAASAMGATAGKNT